MPVIQFGGYTTDPFGGPAGGTQQALAGLLDSYMKTQESQKKREQEQLLAELLGTNPNDNQVPGADGISMNLPQDPQAVANDPATAQARFQAVMTNPNIPIQQKLVTGQMLKMQQDLMPDPLVEKDVPEIVRLQRYMDRLPEDSPQRAQLAARIEVLSSRKEQTDPEIIRLQDKLKDYPEGSPRHQEILNRIRVLSTEGSSGSGGKTREEREQDLRDAVKEPIGDKWYSEPQIDKAWKNSVRYIEPWTPRWMGLSDEEKKANEQRLAEKPYDQFLEDARRKGYLPGRGPLSEAATVPMPDETAKKGPAPSVRAPKDTPKERDGLPSKEEVKALMVETGWKEGEPVTPAVKARARALYEQKKAKGK
jgi:hypothetical protein